MFHVQALVRLVMVWVPLIVVISGVAMAWASTAVGVAVGVCWLFAQFMLAVWLPTFSFERWGYLLRENDLLVTHGVFFREVTALPSARIQHVDMRQGPIEQWWGLARVFVYTASGMGADVVIPGLEYDVAVRLRDELAAVSGDDGV